MNEDPGPRGPDELVAHREDTGEADTHMHDTARETDAPGQENGQRKESPWVTAIQRELRAYLDTVDFGERPQGMTLSGLTRRRSYTYSFPGEEEVHMTPSRGTDPLPLPWKMLANGTVEVELGGTILNVEQLYEAARARASITLPEGVLTPADASMLYARIAEGAAAINDRARKIRNDRHRSALAAAVQPADESDDA